MYAAAHLLRIKRNWYEGNNTELIGAIHDLKTMDCLKVEGILLRDDALCGRMLASHRERCCFQLPNEVYEPMSDLVWGSFTSEQSPSY